MLDRAQIRARFWRMRRVGVPERVRRDAFVDAGLPRGEAHPILLGTTTLPVGRLASGFVQVAIC